MNNINKILVNCSTQDEAHIGIQRAVMLAQRYAAELQLVAVLYNQSYEMTSILRSEEREAIRSAMIQDRKLTLDSLINQYVPKELASSIEVIWHNREYEALCDVVDQQKPDLLIKYCAKESALAHLFLTPIDWQLLRHAHCDILFVNNTNWVPNGNVLAALSVHEPDLVHQALNQSILNSAEILSDSFDAQLHVVNCYPFPIIDVPLSYTGLDYTSYCKTIKTTHEKEVTSILEQYPVNKDNIHVLEGLPEEVIPTLASAIHAELVVMGTVARKGLKAALIGNTAERILDKMSCDVLALRSD